MFDLYNVYLIECINECKSRKFFIGRYICLKLWNVYDEFFKSFYF